jgi:hypothetical protein
MGRWCGGRRHAGGVERPIGFDEPVWLSFPPEAATVLTY